MHATPAATRRARRTKSYQHVFRDEDGYEIGSDYDAETWFQGQSPVSTIAPDGTLESSLS